jgi:type II secretory pathway component PulJ
LASEWVNYAALAVAAASLLTSYLRTAKLQGADRQRIAALEARCAALASDEAVASDRKRIDDLERQMREVLTSLGAVGVLAESVKGLDRLVTVQLDEIKWSLRRSNDAAAGTDAPPRRRPPRPA